MLSSPKNLESHALYIEDRFGRSASCLHSSRLFVNVLGKYNKMAQAAPNAPPASPAAGWMKTCSNNCERMILPFAHAI